MNPHGRNLLLTPRRRTPFATLMAWQTLLVFLCSLFAPCLASAADELENPLTPLKEAFDPKLQALGESVKNLEKTAAPVLDEVKKGQVFETMVTRNEGYLAKFMADSKAWEKERGLNSTGDELAFLTGNKNLGAGVDRFTGKIRTGFGALLNRLKGIRPGDEKARVELKAIADEAGSRLETTSDEQLGDLTSEVEGSVKEWSARNQPEGKVRSYLKKIFGGMKEQSTLAAGEKGRFATAIDQAGNSSVNSLKQSFSLKGIGLTVGISMACQIVRSFTETGKVDFKGAVRQITAAEFGAGVVGSALGAAGGHFAGTLARAFIPGIFGSVLGAVMPAIGAAFAGQMSSGLVTHWKTDKKLLIKETWKRIDKPELLGSAVGSTFGAILGSMVPIPFVGTLLGGMIGGYIGGKIGKAAAEKLGGSFSNLRSTLFPKINHTENQHGLTTPAGEPSQGQFQSIAGVRSNDAAKLKAAHERYMAAFKTYEGIQKTGRTDLARPAFNELKKAQREYYLLKE